MLKGYCERHTFEHVVDYCGMCGLAFCADCLIYSHGPKKAPYCHRCALVAGGIKNTRMPGVSKKELRRQQKERKRRLRKADTATPEHQVPIEADLDWSKLNEEEPPPERAPGFEEEQVEA